MSVSHANPWPEPALGNGLQGSSALPELLGLSREKLEGTVLGM